MCVFYTYIINILRTHTYIVQTNIYTYIIFSVYTKLLNYTKLHTTCQMNAIAVWTAHLKTSVTAERFFPVMQSLEAISNLMKVLCAFTQKDRKFPLQRRMYLAWFSSSSDLVSFSHFLFRCPSVSSPSPPLPPSCLLINDRSAAEKQSMSVQEDSPGLSVLSVSWPRACC